MTSLVNEQQLKLIEGICHFYRNKQLSDVTLVVGNEEFPCNKNVLAASSPYFRAMLTSEVQESQQSRIVMYDINAASLSMLLDYMYYGEVVITDEIVQDLYIIANQFELLTLVDLCSKHMSNEISLNNCIDLFAFSQFHYNQQLQKSVLEFMQENFTEFSQIEDFNSKVDCELLEYVLVSDELNVEYEENVFEVIMSWINCDVDTRLKYLPKLFKLLRLPLIDVDYYKNQIVTNDLIQSSPFCRGVMACLPLFKINAKSNENEAESFDICGRQRSGMFVKDLIIFSGGSDSAENRAFCAFDPKSRKNYVGISHHPSFDFKFRMDYFKLVTVQKTFIYFIGGIFYDDYHFEETGPAQRNIFLYDQKSTTWIKKEPMLYPRCAFAACVYGDDIFVLGGRSTFPLGDTKEDVEVYDTTLDRWSPLEPMPMRLHHHTASVCNDGLFVFGGMDFMDEMSDAVFRYDLKIKEWTVVRTNLLKPRSELSALTINDKIFIIGGTHKHENALSVEIYDPMNNRWRYGSDFPDERKFTAITEVDGEILVCGGVRTLGRPGRRMRHVETKDLYAYDIKYDTWKKEVRMVQYANTTTCSSAKVNYRALKESDFVSYIDGAPINSNA